jgi:hypothetical protein
VRSKALGHCGWFPAYTITEDYALGIELKTRDYKWVSAAGVGAWGQWDEAAVLPGDLGAEVAGGWCRVHHQRWGRQRNAARAGCRERRGRPSCQP